MNTCDGGVVFYEYIPNFTFLIWCVLSFHSVQKLSSRVKYWSMRSAQTPDLFYPVDSSSPSIWMGSRLWSGRCTQGLAGVGRWRIWYCYTSSPNSSLSVQLGGGQRQIPSQSQLHCSQSWRYMIPEAYRSVLITGDTQRHSVALCYGCSIHCWSRAPALGRAFSTRKWHWKSPQS